MTFTDREFDEIYTNLKISLMKIENGCDRKLRGKQWTHRDRQRCIERRDFLRKLINKFDNQTGENNNG